MAIQNLKDCISVACTKKKCGAVVSMVDCGNKPNKSKATSLLSVIQIYSSHLKIQQAKCHLCYFWNKHFHSWNKRCSIFGNTAKNGSMSKNDPQIPTTVCLTASMEKFHPLCRMLSHADALNGAQGIAPNLCLPQKNVVLNFFQFIRKFC